MLKEFVEIIGGLAVAADERIVALPNEPGHVYGVVNPKTGELARTTADPEPRRHVVYSLDDLVAAVTLAAGKPCSVWYSSEGVTLLLDDATRRDRVTFPLALSEPCKMLLEMESKPARRKQADLIWWLRTTWARYLADHGVVNALRNLRWNYLKETTEEIIKGKASLGKSIEAKVSGANALPDTIAVNFPVFSRDRGHGGTVDIVLEADAANEQFVLAVEAGAVEACIAEAESQIGTVLSVDLENVESVSLFFGKP